MSRLILKPQHAHPGRRNSTALHISISSYANHLGYSTSINLQKETQCLSVICKVQRAVSEII